MMAEPLTMALAGSIGRTDAFQLVEDLTQRASQAGQSLRDVAQADERVRAHLSPEAIDRVLDPANYLGSTDLFIDRVLSNYAAVRAICESNG
jgi:3-carboxy-cis,cis-muconate cycloisomerase